MLIGQERAGRGEPCPEDVKRYADALTVMAVESWFYYSLSAFQGWGMAGNHWNKRQYALFCDDKEPAKRSEDGLVTHPKFKKFEKLMTQNAAKDQEEHL